MAAGPGATRRCRAPNADDEARPFFFYLPRFFSFTDGVFVLVCDVVPPPALLVYRTHDGGTTWQLGAALPMDVPTTSPVAWPSFVWSFADPSHGWALQLGHLFITTDGGASWQTVTTSANLLNVRQLDALTPRLVFAVQYQEVGDRTYAGQLLRTEDGGHTWIAWAPRKAASVASSTKSRP